MRWLAYQTITTAADAVVTTGGTIRCVITNIVRNTPTRISRASPRRSLIGIWKPASFRRCSRRSHTGGALNRPGTVFVASSPPCHRCRVRLPLVSATNGSRRCRITASRSLLRLNHRSTPMPHSVSTRPKTAHPERRASRLAAGRKNLMAWASCGGTSDELAALEDARGQRQAFLPHALEHLRPDVAGLEIALRVPLAVDPLLLVLEEILHEDHLALHAGDLRDRDDLAAAAGHARDVDEEVERARHLVPDDVD